MKLLIVDDHSGLRSMIRQVIQQPGDVVMECASGEEAVRVVRAFDPDWVSIDFRLGGMSGIALARSIRTMCPAARCVLVSSYEAEELRSVAKEAGAVAYIQKENLSELGKLVHASRQPADSSACQLSNFQI